jgi:hypothetical protein
MIVPVFDLWTIVIATTFDVIVDIVIFKLFHIKSITVVIALLLNFLVPYIGFMMYIQTRPSIEQAIPVLTDFIGNMMVNLVNYSISAVFGFIISGIIYTVTLGHTEKPEFEL